MSHRRFFPFPNVCRSRLSHTLRVPERPVTRNWKNKSGNFTKWQRERDLKIGGDSEGIPGIATVEKQWKMVGGRGERWELIGSASISNANEKPTKHFSRVWVFFFFWVFDFLSDSNGRNGYLTALCTWRELETVLTRFVLYPLRFRFPSRQRDVVSHAPFPPHILVGNWTDQLHCVRVHTLS